MKELILWKEVDKDEWYQIVGKIPKEELIGGRDGNGKNVWLKRVAIRILSDQEIIKLADKIDDFFVERCGCPSSGSSRKYNEFKEILKESIREQLKV